MAIVDTPLTLAYQWPQITTFTNNVIDASGEMYGMTFYAPKTGTIDRIGFRTNTVTTGATVDVRLETVNDVGQPSGSLVSAGANASQVIADANDNVFFEVTLGTPASVTRNQRLAIVIVWAASGNMQLASMGGGNNTWTLNGTALFTASWALSGNSIGVGSIRYDDTTYPSVSGIFPCSSITLTNTNTGTTPDERATKFVAPIDCRMIGAQTIVGSWADGEDFDVILYDSGGSTLASTSVTGGLASVPRHGLFSSAVDLAAGSTYRLSILPTTANSFTVAQYTWAVSGAAKGNAAGATVWSVDSSTRTNAGSWSDDTTTGHHIIPVLSGFDDGAGGAAVQYGYPSGA